MWRQFRAGSLRRNMGSFGPEACPDCEPNIIVIQGPTFALCYRARPDGADPNSCLFEVYVIERFPKGEEPRPDNIWTDIDDHEIWRKVLCQDFSNMAAVQRGIQSRGFADSHP